MPLDEQIIKWQSISWVWHETFVCPRVFCFVCGNELVVNVLKIQTFYIKVGVSICLEIPEALVTFVTMRTFPWPPKLEAGGCLASADGVCPLWETHHCPSSVASLIYVSCLPSGHFIFMFLLLNTYSFTWLCQVLTVAHESFIANVGSSSSCCALPWLPCGM